MSLHIIHRFLWIQYARIALAMGLVGGMLLAGFLARSPWLVLLVTPLFTVLYAMGKWTAFTGAWRAGGARKVLAGLAMTLPVQAVVASVFYLMGLGASRLFGSPTIADLALIDVGIALAGFAVCVAACAGVIAGEANLKRQSAQVITTQDAQQDEHQDEQQDEQQDAQQMANQMAATSQSLPAGNKPSATKATASKVEGRISFAGNPWPKGHRIASCTFNASIHPSVGDYTQACPNPGPGLMLEFELTTADYSEDDPTDRDAEGDSDWTSKIAWNNYHSARIGPSQSSQVQGLRVSDGAAPFVFDLPEYRFTADTLPINPDTFHETAGFGIYLLGHDSVANHDIRLHCRQPDGSYTLDWTGKIALTYGGDDEFKYDFKAHVTGVRFDTLGLFYFDVGRAKEYCGIDLDPNLSARDYIAPFVSDPDNFVFKTDVDGLGRAVVSAKRGDSCS